MTMQQTQRLDELLDKPELTPQEQSKLADLLTKQAQDEHNIYWLPGADREEREEAMG